MIEVQHRVAVVRRHRVVETSSPIARQFENVRRAERRSADLPLVGDLDREPQRPLWHRISAIEDLRQDFVAKSRSAPGILG